MGFDRDTAMAMARTEHEAWCHHLRERGWKDGPIQDTKRKIHNKLLNWDGVQADPQLLKATLARLATLEQLRLMGFDRDAAMAMARTEHRDWCRYLREWGWTYGTVRDNQRKVHNKLVAWDIAEADPETLNTALTSLATTLLKLRQLGYRSRPLWERYRRAGTVVAEQRASPWTWTSDNGETMQANAGDWAVHDGTGKSWSVRDDIFRSTYQQIEGNRWRRTGFVHARRASDGEKIATLEGPITTKEGYWVVRGAADDQWAMPAEEFAKRYEGPVPEGENSESVTPARHGAAPEP